MSRSEGSMVSGTRCEQAAGGYEVSRSAVRMMCEQETNTALARSRNQPRRRPDAGPKMHFFSPLLPLFAYNTFPHSPHRQHHPIDF